MKGHRRLKASVKLNALGEAVHKVTDTVCEVSEFVHASHALVQYSLVFAFTRPRSVNTPHFHSFQG